MFVKSAGPNSALQNLEISFCYFVKLSEARLNVTHFVDEVIGHTVKSVELEEHLVSLLGEGKPKRPFTPRTI